MLLATIRYTIVYSFYALSAFASSFIASLIGGFEQYHPLWTSPQSLGLYVAAMVCLWHSGCRRQAALRTPAAHVIPLSACRLTTHRTSKRPLRGALLLVCLVLTAAILLRQQSTVNKFESFVGLTGDLQIMRHDNNCGARGAGEGVQ